MLASDIIKKVAVITIFLLIALLFGGAFSNGIASANGTVTERLTLEEAIKMGLNSSKPLKVAAQGVNIAEHVVREAEAAFRPQVGYQVDVNRAEEDRLTPYGIIPDESSTGAVSITQPLYTGGKLSSSLKMAQHRLEMAREAERRMKQAEIFKLNRGYFQLWLAERRLEVARSSYENLDRHLSEVQLLYQAGTVSKFELLRAGVQRDGIKPEVIQAENGVSLARMNLDTLLGIGQNYQYRLEFDLNSLKLPERISIAFEKAFMTAQVNRPELKQIREELVVNQQMTVLADSGKRPQVALTGKYGGESDNYNPPDWDFTWNVTVGLNGLLYDGGATQAKIEQARQNEKQTLLKEADLNDQIRLEVEQAIQGLKEALETVRANQANIELAQEALRLTQVRFENGMATTMDIIDAQLALDKALNGYYQGVSDYSIALARFDLITGKY